MKSLKNREDFISNKELVTEIIAIAKNRTGSFIGMLDGKIGNKDYKSLKKEKMITKTLALN